VASSAPARHSPTTPRLLWYEESAHDRTAPDPAADGVQHHPAEQHRGELLRWWFQAILDLSAGPPRKSTCRRRRLGSPVTGHAPASRHSFHLEPTIWRDHVGTGPTKPRQHSQELLSAAPCLSVSQDRPSLNGERRSRVGSRLRSHQADEPCSPTSILGCGHG
jgi:hypothetical protein